MRRLTTGISTEKRVVRRFSSLSEGHSVLTQIQTVQYSPLHAQSVWYSLLLLGYKPVQHVTVLNTVANCNTMVSIIILYYNFMGPPSIWRPSLAETSLRGA